MQHNAFNPQNWLDRWKQAGGGWAAGHLLLLDGNTTALNDLAAELDDDRREALRQHLTEKEATE